MNRHFTIFFFLFFFAVSLSAQTPVIALGNTMACAEQEVLVPVQANALYNMGALTLFITYDTTRLIFVDLQNVDAQLNGISSSTVADPPGVVVAWSGLNGADYPAPSKLFDLHLFYTSGENLLQFAAGCEVADVSLQILPVTLTDGSVNPGEPLIGVPPHNVNTRVGSDAVFQVSSPNASQYHWSESVDNGMTWIFLEDNTIYTGTHDAELTLHEVPLTFNNNQYRAELTTPGCSVNTLPVLLTVDSMSSNGKDLNGSVPISCLQVCPNPLTSPATLDYQINKNGIVRITVLNSKGQILATLYDDFQQQGFHKINIPDGEFRAGSYFCRLNLNDGNDQWTAMTKMIKLN